MCAGQNVFSRRHIYERGFNNSEAGSSRIECIFFTNGIKNE